MTPAALLSVVAGVWWLCSVAVLLVSFAAALAHPVRRRRTTKSGDFPGVSAIVPIKHLHADFERALRSLFTQDYAGLEVLISAQEARSPAVEGAERVRHAFPGVPSQILQSRLKGAASPKLNTLWPALCEAGNDLILTKDSNLRLEPGELECLVRELSPGTGLVSTIAIAREPRSFAAWIEVAILNNYHARILMLADAAGLGFGLGKIMLFRRSDLMRVGGFECLAWALGEDMALAGALERLGLRTVLARCVSRQTLGARSFSEIWQRQLRWMIVWRIQMPAAFIGDFLGSAGPTAVAGAAAATLFGVSPWLVATSTLAGWFILESLLCALKGWPLALLSLPAFVAREILTPVLWLRACTTREVIWAGTMQRAGSRPPKSRFTSAPVAPVAGRADQ
ncbi:MAG TPA: glycosyltransferase [Rhizomicrobium sp.]